MIQYVFKMAGGVSHTFDVDLERAAVPSVDEAEHAAWTRLEFHQCANCPLRPDSSRYCPAAVALEPVVHVFARILSYEEVEVEVHTPERTYWKRCDAQTGLRALAGLIMATSACPILGRLKGLAQFHLPFATLEETVFRTVGAYLVAQYYRARDGQPPDLALSGLDEFYGRIETVDQCFKQRLDAICEQDANLNALGSLYCLASGLSELYEDHLEMLRPTFAAFSELG